MNYYAYMNKNGLNNEEFTKVNKFVKNFKKENFAELGVNTVYVTFRNDKPFIYKTTNTEDKLHGNIFDSLYPIAEDIDKLPCYNAIIVDETIKD